MIEALSDAGQRGHDQEASTAHDVLDEDPAQPTEVVRLPVDMGRVDAVSWLPII